MRLQSYSSIQNMNKPLQAHCLRVRDSENRQLPTQTPRIMMRKVPRATGVRPSPRIIGISHRISDAPVRVSPSIKLVLDSITLLDQFANRIPTIIFNQFPVVASATTVSIAKTHIRVKTKTYSHHFISPYGSFSPVFTVATFIRICMGV